MISQQTTPGEFLALGRPFGVPQRGSRSSHLQAVDHASVRPTLPVWRLMALCCLLASSLVASEIHISPAGSDSNDGTAAKPFATIQRGQQAVREASAANPGHRELTHVVLHGGTYRQTTPLVFTPDDSGSEGAPVIYEAAAGEKVVISGGKLLAGEWVQTEGKPYWQILLPEVKEGHWNFVSLAVDGESRMRSRYPKEGDKELRGVGAEPGGDARQSLVYRTGDFDPSWTNPEDIDLILMGFWSPVIHRVREIDATKQAIRFKSQNFRTVNQFERLPRYYLSNVFEKMGPGEWYLNKKTGILYYCPLPGENLAKAEVVAPLLNSSLVEIQGDLSSDKPVQHLQFKGIHFRDTDTDLDRYDGMYRQGHMFLGAAIRATALRHGLFQGCTFEQLGDYALELGDGCRDVTVEKCHFWDLGAGALQIGVTDLNTLLKPAGSGTLAKGEAEPLREVSGIVVDNNCIHKIGTIWNGCYGIVNRFASGTKITHNEIFDTHWDAIGLDARWTPSGGKVYAHGNEVAYNHLHHLGLRTETDAGGIYQFAPLDTHIHHNLIHDTFAYPYNTGFTSVYLDETSRGAVVENNIAYNLDGFSYLQNYGDGNVFRNNIGAFARDGFFHMGSLHDDLNYAEVTRNIYVTTNDVAQTENYPKGKKPPLVSSNFYQTLEEGKPLLFCGKSLSEWQAKGWDQGSVEGNAGFRDPLRGDFTLKADSPTVTRIGFVPFGEEIAKAGLYGDPAWRDFPKSCRMRKPYAFQTMQDLGAMNDCSIDPNDYKPGTKFPIFSSSEQSKGKDSMVVTDEVAGVNGPHCIKVTDKASYAASFYPYAGMQLYGLDRGKVELGFAFMQPTNSPAGCDLQLRCGVSSYRVGPSIKITREGAIMASGKEIGKMIPGEWTRFNLSFGLGADGNNSYELTMSNSAGQTKQTLPFVHGDFKEATRLVVFSPDKGDGNYYLDAISLKTERK